MTARIRSLASRLLPRQTILPVHLASGRTVSLAARNFSTSNHNLDIAPPLSSPSNLVDQLPRYADNRIQMNVGNLENFSSMNGESQFGDESSNPLAGIAPPIQAKSVPAARADEPRVNNTNIGQVHRFSDQEVNTIFSNQIHITGYGPDFTMIGDVVAKGSLVLLPSVFLHWKPRTWQEVTSESLAILSFLHPVPDLVLFGTGLKYQAPSNSLHHFMKTFNIKYDIMATTNAMGTYNILNEEGRRVAAFIIPLTEQEHDTYKSRENAPLF